VPTVDVGHLATAPIVTAPDTMAVRVLTRLPTASAAVFELPPGGVSRPGHHGRVDESWFVVAGTGEMWVQPDGGEAQVVPLTPGSTVAFTSGVAFQVRSTGDAPLQVFGVTTPPWPEDRDDEWQPVPGRWPT
jgi:mannose-6-phosphate isomerase-like protein (cupin superfamily)